MTELDSGWDLNPEPGHTPALESAPDTDQDDASTSAPTAAATAADEAAGLYFSTLPEFVTDFLAPTFGRDLDAPALTWCPRWWLYPEAINRLESLWRSWGHLRRDPALGSSTGLRDHLDHHLPVLLSLQGPFKGCSPTKGHTHRGLTAPSDHPPAGLFANSTNH